MKRSGLMKIGCMPKIELEPLTIPADCEYCAIDECGDFEAIGYLRGRAICARCLARLNENK